MPEPMIGRWRWAPPAAGLLLSASLLLGPAVTVRAEEGAPAPADPTLQAFEELHARVRAEVEAGGLPPGAEAAAEALRFELEKDLIRSGAEIDVLELEVVRYSGAEQREALERLVAAAAARERKICRALRELERLAGMPATAILEEAEEPPADEEKGGYEITFEPEDLIEDPDS